ncbi:Hypothetical protein FKW44_003282 [Caligus rogercresseyi]|uniref:Uncharacterized protein n=1 Tax=Caligus rogercresseyi TaxID=217165 RepID=A0A7T8KLE6_CALRO|nr:Hypothetical protein FKW44_003282 [Caligus rogercresseyi]
MHGFDFRYQAIFEGHYGERGIKSDSRCQGDSDKEARGWKEKIEEMRMKALQTK